MRAIAAVVDRSLEFSSTAAAGSSGSGALDLERCKSMRNVHQHGAGPPGARERERLGQPAGSSSIASTRIAAFAIGAAIATTSVS